jgi:hypothetical protein
MTRRRSTRAARTALALVAASLLTVGGAACSRDQDPGIVPTASTRAGDTTQPPRLLEPCPPGGPDADTPAAGCVDEDGNVLHP